MPIQTIDLCSCAALCTAGAEFRCRVRSRGMLGQPILACPGHRDKLQVLAESHGNTLEVETIAPVIAAGRAS